MVSGLSASELEVYTTNMTKQVQQIIGEILELPVEEQDEVLAALERLREGPPGALDVRTPEGMAELQDRIAEAERGENQIPFEEALARLRAEFPYK
jgi:hypothetical protein